MKISPFLYGLIAGFIIGMIVFMRSCCPTPGKPTVITRIDTIRQPPIVIYLEDTNPKPLPPTTALQIHPSIDTTKQNAYTKTFRDTNYVLTINSITSGTLDLLTADFKLTPPPRIRETITIYEPCPAGFSLYAGINVTTSQNVYLSGVFIPKSRKNAYQFGWDPVNRSYMAGAYISLKK